MLRLFYSGFAMLLIVLTSARHQSKLHPLINIKCNKIEYRNVHISTSRAFKTIENRILDELKLFTNLK